MAGGGEVAAAGRVMLKRVLGRLAFLTLRDGSGETVQLYLDRSVMNEEDPEAYRCSACCPPPPPRGHLPVLNLQLHHGRHCISTSSPWAGPQSARTKTAAISA